MNAITKGVVGIFIWLVISAPLPSFAQGIQPVDRLAVFDANGVRVGPVGSLQVGENETSPINWVLVPLVMGDFVGYVRMKDLHQPSPL